MSPGRVGRRADGDRERIAALEALVAGLTRELREREATAEARARSERLEAVGRLAGGIAHDIGNLMTAIRGHADLAVADVPQGGHAADDLREIVGAAERAQSLLRQLLAFSRRQVMDIRPVDVSGVALGLEWMLSRLVGDNVRLRVEAADPLCVVVGDPGQLEQVIVNLVVNARDAMPDGGDLTVAVARGEGTDGRLPSAELTGTTVSLTVTDTGTGMDPETLERIFEPFFTTKPSHRGTGLGLATVYGIVKQMGGAIDVRSAPGEGSAFTVYLPAADESARRAAAAARSGRQQPIQRGAEVPVVLVEADPAVRRLVHRLLASMGFVVREVAPELVASMVEDPAATPAAAVVGLRGIGGAEGIRRLRSAWPDAPLVVIGQRGQEAALRVAAVGADAPFLAKPFTGQQVRDALLAAGVNPPVDSANRLPGVAATDDQSTA